jgi:hypothetical protein
MYLISLSLDLRGLNKTLRTHGLAEIEENYYNQLRGELDLPVGFNGKDRRHVPSYTALRRQGLVELWFAEDYPFVKNAYSILGNPQIRHIVDTLSSTPATFEEIAAAINERLALHISPDTIMFYSRVFSNFAIMTPEELMEYSKIRKEWWRMAALKGDTDLLMYHLGFDVKLATDRVVNDVYAVGFMKIKELKEMPTSMELARAYGEYAKGVQWAHEQRKSSQDRLQELTKALQIKYEDGEDKSYEEDLPPGGATPLLENARLEFLPTEEVTTNAGTDQPNQPQQPTA